MLPVEPHPLLRQAVGSALQIQDKVVILVCLTAVAGFGKVMTLFAVQLHLVRMGAAPPVMVRGAAFVPLQVPPPRPHLRHPVRTTMLVVLYRHREAPVVMMGRRGLGYVLVQHVLAIRPPVHRRRRHRIALRAKTIHIAIAMAPAVIMRSVVG